MTATRHACFLGLAAWLVVAGQGGCSKGPTGPPPTAGPATGSASSSAHPLREKGQPPLPMPAADGSAPPAAGEPLKLTVRRFYDETVTGEYRILDKELATQKFGGKSIALTGVVRQLGTSRHLAGPYQFFAILGAQTERDGSPAQKFNNEFVRCFLTEPEPWKKLAVGDTATIRCTLHPDGYFEDGTVLEGGAGAIELSAAELAAAVIADPAAAVQKYDGKSLVVSGKVLANQVKDKTAKLYLAATLLAGQDGMPLGLHYTMVEERDYDKLAPGDPIQVIGLGAIDPQATGKALKVGLHDSFRLDVLPK